MGSRQQYGVVVGGEFHSTDGFSEGAGRGWAYVELGTERVAGLSERRDREVGGESRDMGTGQEKAFGIS